jgi:NTE family protein
VYDNHGLEPIVKRYMTVFVSDGGAPFGRSGNLPVDWISQLRRVLEVADNQVRALRRRDLIERLREGNRAFAAGTLAANDVRPRERMGAYWGIDTDAARLDPSDALPCSGQVTDRLARVATRLSDLGERTSQELVKPCVERDLGSRPGMRSRQSRAARDFAHAFQLVSMVSPFASPGLSRRGRG